MLPRYHDVHTKSYRRRLQGYLTAVRRRWRRIFIVFLALYFIAIYTRQKHPFSSKPHEITPALVEFEIKHNITDDFLSVAEATELCKAQKWAPYPRRDEKRKIYDLIMLNGELDWLEIRLETMAKHVSYFVILESTVTFTGLPKSLTLKDNWAHFSKFHPKIIYRELANPPIDAKRTWDLEDYQRNAMLLQGVMGSGVEAEKRARQDDVLIVADVDELVRPATLLVLRECQIPARVTLRSRFYYYGFQWEHRGEEWPHPQATVFRGENTILPADLRNGEGGNRVLGWWEKADLWNSGWHCSSCFAAIGDMLNKMQSFSHTSLNQEKFRDRTRIVDRVRKGLDLWDRPGEIYEWRQNNNDIPDFLKGEEEKKRFGYMLNRDGSDAGFTDYGPEEDAGD